MYLCIVLFLTNIKLKIGGSVLSFILYKNLPRFYRYISFILKKLFFNE